MTLELFFAMVTFALVCSITPGPVNIAIVTSTLAAGWKTGLKIVTGATVGFTILLLLVGLGMQQVINQLPWLIAVIGWLGLLFFLYMAYQLWVSDGALGFKDQNKKASYGYGAALQWLNPKAWLACVSGMNTYAINADMFTMLGFCLIFFSVCYVSLAMWMWAGISLKHYLTQPKLVRMFNRTMAILLVISCFYLIQKIT